MTKFGSWRRAILGLALFLSMMVGVQLHTQASSATALNWVNEDAYYSGNWASQHTLYAQVGYGYHQAGVQLDSHPIAYSGTQFCGSYSCYLQFTVYHSWDHAQYTFLLGESWADVYAISWR